MCLGLLVVLGIVVEYFVRRSLTAAFDGAHDLAIASVLETLDRSASGLGVKGKAFEEEVAEIEATLGVVGVAVFDRDDRPLASAAIHGRTLVAHGAARAVQGEGAGAIVVRRVRLAASDGGGTIVVARSAAPLLREISAVRRGLVLTSPLALLAAVLLATWLARRALGPVRETLDRQRAFMADASHELRTPLAVVRAHAENALASGAEPSATRTALEVIVRTTVEAGSLLDGLLTLARTDSGGGLVQSRDPVDLEDLAEEAAQAFAPLAAAKGSVIRVRTLGDPTVLGDGTELARALGILLDNAIRHAPAGDIDVEVIRTSSAVEIRVEDHGPGIPASLRERVFERFVRGPGGGAGLGLAIAQSVARGHDGELRLDGNARGGTTAVLALRPWRGSRDARSPP